MNALGGAHQSLLRQYGCNIAVTANGWNNCVAQDWMTEYVGDGQ